MEKCCVFRKLIKASAVVAIAFAGFLGLIGYFAREPIIVFKASARPAPSRAGLSAIYLSGDMGFDLALSRVVLNRLSADGVPVIGVNSLIFFRQRRTQAEVTALITDAMRRALTFGRAKRLILIGQSFGADMLQAGLTGLSKELRSKVGLVALIVPSKTLDYQVSVFEILARATPDADGFPTARQLTWAPTICIYGGREKDSLCPMLPQLNVRKVALPGGHFLRHDGNGLYTALMSGLR
jgi:type IV secretory pathway VirJ component